LKHGAEIGESTVHRYMAEAKASRPVALAQVNVPQSHPAGEEAEVDFGQISFRLAGEQVIGRMFVMRLSASGKAFHRIYANEAQEVFIDGQVRAFEHFGGVPGRIRYDNLKPAVVRVLKGRDRKVTERFVAMRSHYGFDSFFLARRAIFEFIEVFYNRQRLHGWPDWSPAMDDSTCSWSTSSGYIQLDTRGAELLFQILTEREEKASVAIGSNLPFSEWGQVVTDPVWSPPLSTG
jgi:hypothetical protein